MVAEDASQDEEMTGKIYCANCSNCVVFKQPIQGADAYVRRVRCKKGIWKKKSGEEKIYKYFSIIRRTMERCDFYDPMGDAKSFIRELRKSLPIKDEIYSYSPTHQELRSQP
jgi:hypothetical protein